jgi:hypothetical protein
MARKEEGSDKGRVKVRVIEFELDGSNQTLRDSIRDIVGAIGRAPPMQKAPAKLTGGSSRQDDDQQLDDPADFSVASEETSDVEDGEDSTEERTPRKRSRPRTPRPVNVDLRKRDVPLKTFLASAPEPVDKRYVLIAYWFKKYADTPVVSMDHIYTAYTEMSWTSQLPSDVGQPLRKLKFDGVFDKADGGYTLNHLGEGRAEDMIAAATAPK